jgi:heme exporter protein D
VLKDFVWGWYVALALLLALMIIGRRKFLKMAEEKRRREA